MMVYQRDWLSTLRSQNFGIGIAATASMLALLNGVASAKPLTFDADDDVLIVRCYDTYGSAECEFLAEGGDTRILQCVALDAEETPIAVSRSLASDSSITFIDLDVGLIAKVVCR